MAIKKVELRPEGINDYGDVLYPKTSVDMVDGLVDMVEGLSEGYASKSEFDTHAMKKSGGTFTGIVKAHPNTSNTTSQIRNIILSTGDAVVGEMKDGDIWIKYE